MNGRIPDTGDELHDGGEFDHVHSLLPGGWEIQEEA